MTEESARKVGEWQSDLRRMGLEMAELSGADGSHLGGSFSAMDIIAVLYGAVLDYRADDPGWEERDRFLASKRHCYLALYPALVKAGIMTRAEMLTYHEDGGQLAGYPRSERLGLEYCGGSLAMGPSIGVGMALAAKARGQRHGVYVLVGDGECDEGAVWEALMSAAKYRLDNYVLVVDANGLQFDGASDDVMPLGDLATKLAAFGFEAVEVDGHSAEALLGAFRHPHEGRPLAVVAHTVKAKGLPSIEGKPESHHARLKPEDRDYMLSEIEGGAYGRVQ